MPDALDLLRRFRDDTPGPSHDAWRRARRSIAHAASESTSSPANPTNRVLRRPRHSSPPNRPRLTLRDRGGRGLLIGAALTLCLVVATVVVVTTTDSGPRLSAPVRTSWRPARALPRSTSHITAPSGTWVLSDYLTNAGWQQSTTGPEPGYLTCPTSLTCYVTGDNASSSSGPALYNSMYVSHDGALSWSVLPVPTGLYFTTALTCATTDACAAGATDAGQPVLITTSDGGHSFTIDPLPAGVGALYSLSCPALNFCGGLAATSADPNATPIDATFLSTLNNGASFADSPLPNDDSMSLLACPAAGTCVVAGTSDAAGVNDWTAGVVASTSDDGATWSSGSFPTGFGVNYLSTLSCGDSLHCSVTGDIAIQVSQSKSCSSLSPPSVAPTTSSTTTTTTPPSPAVAAIAQRESALASQAGAIEAQHGIIECGPNTTQLISDVASSSDGGISWVPEQLPNSAPSPQLNDIACVGPSYCVATGSVEVLQRFPSGAENGGSAIVLVTRDGGESWNSVSFAVPSSVPSGVQIDAYMAVGTVQCPEVDDCVALGVSDQGSKTTPVYTSNVVAASANDA